MVKAFFTGSIRAAQATVCSLVAATIYSTPAMSVAAYLAEPEHGGGHGGEHEAAHGGFTLFNWPSEMGEPVGLVFLLINFVVLLLILNRLVFTPLRTRNAQRSERIAGELARATEARQEAEALLKQSQDRLEHIERESKEVLDNAKRRAESTRKEILDGAESEAARIVQNAHDFAEREQKRIRDQIEAEVVERAINQAEAKIREVFSAGDQSRFVDQYAAEVRQLNLASALEATGTGKSSLKAPKPNTFGGPLGTNLGPEGGLN